MKTHSDNDFIVCTLHTAHKKNEASLSSVLATFLSAVGGCLCYRF